MENEFEMMENKFEMLMQNKWAMFQIETLNNIVAGHLEHQVKISAMIIIALCSHDKVICSL